tara:strand:- start:578 stop:1021 length:444 start_codon:yes stop_codon:yes gene_type:complete
MDKYQLLKFETMLMLLLLSCCVSPPEHTDGLLENIPAIVDEQDFFSLSILGDDYTETNTWDIKFLANETDIILATFILKDIKVKDTDSTYFQIFEENGDTILSHFIQSDLTWSSQDSISVVGNPDLISFFSSNFNGRLEYQLLKITN